MSKHWHDVGVVEASGAEDSDVTPHLASIPVNIGHGAGIEIFVAKLVSNHDMERLSVDGFGKNVLHGARVFDDREDLAHNIDIVELGEREEIGIATTVNNAATGGGKTNGAGFFGEDASGFLKETINLSAVIPDTLFDAHLFGYREIVLTHKLTHVELEGDWGRDTTCTGVGLFEVTQVFEPDHLVADSGGTNAKIVFFVESL